LTDRIKTSIFDLIRDFVSDARVLDLYAGSGSFGIEALSRGAQSAVFVDLATEAMECIEENLINSNFLESAHVIQEKVNDFIAKTPERFDIIFLDPPFPDTSNPDFDSLAKILRPSGVLIYRSFVKKKFTTGKAPLENVYEKVYGKSRVSFYKLKE
jgi:16S rRNA (guanine(966)-N(2))-methyltransferase RsmD